MILLPNSSANIVLKRDASNNVIYGATGTDDTTDKLVYARGITSTISNAAPTTNNNWSCTISYPVADGKWIYCDGRSGNFAFTSSAAYFPPLPGYYEMCFEQLVWTPRQTNYWHTRSLGADSYIWAPSDIWAGNIGSWYFKNGADIGASAYTLAASGLYSAEVNPLYALVINVGSAHVSTITDPSPIITTPTQSNVPSPSSPLTVTPSITSSYSASTSGSVNCYCIGGVIVQYVYLPYGVDVGQGSGSFFGTAREVGGLSWTDRDTALEGGAGWITNPYPQYASSGIAIRVCCPYTIYGGRSTTTTFSGTATVTRNNGDGSSFSASGGFGNNGTIALTQTS